MTERTGILINSPLICVVASVRFAPWQLLAKKIDEIHDELRDIVPLIHRIQVQQIRIGGPAFTPVSEEVPAAWMIVSSDRSYGIQLASDQLLVFCRKYTRYADFQNIIQRGLETLLKHMRFVDVTNMGVRYVDHIKPIGGETLNDYVSERLLPASFPHLDTVGGASFGTYQSGESELRVRCLTHPGVTSVPDDLAPLFAMLQGQPVAIESLNEGQIVLDMDAVQAYVDPKRMSTEAILDRLRVLHKTANAFFRHESVCTDHAFERWKGEKS